MGKLLILTGFILILAGVTISFHWRLPWVGHLPGDLVVKKENFAFYFPVTTCVLLSLILTLIFRLMKK